MIPKWLYWCAFCYYWWYFHHRKQMQVKWANMINISHWKNLFAHILIQDKCGISMLWFTNLNFNRNVFQKCLKKGLFTDLTLCIFKTIWMPIEQTFSKYNHLDWILAKYTDSTRTQINVNVVFNIQFCFRILVTLIFGKSNPKWLYW